MHEWSDNVELVGVHNQVEAATFRLILPPLCGQVGKSEPLNFANLFSGLRHEIVIHGNITEDKQLHILLPNGLLEGLDIFPLWDQTSSIEIEASLFPCLTNGTVEVVFIFVDLTTWKTPCATLLPAFNQQHLIHLVVQEDGTPHRHTVFILYKYVEGIGQLLFGGVLEERTSLGDALKEGP